MPKPITGLGFRGMNNLPGMPGKLLDDERRITPKVTLNVEVTDGGVLRCRSGYVRKLVLTKPHSLWAGSVMLYVADGFLYRIEGLRATVLGAIPGPPARMNYEEINNLIYLSTPYWNGVYDVLSQELRPWGMVLPGVPDLSVVAGDLPPGEYSLCYTWAEDGRLSGNGPLSQVSWEGGGQGIRLNNLPAGGQCWITNPNGKTLFLATVVSGVISGQTISPLPSFMVTPPPPFNYFAQAFGRIWGISESKLLYSEPFQYEWFKVANYIPFLEEPVMVAPVDEGIFVNSLKSTWFLDGTAPGEMAMRRIGDGAIPGTLTYAQMPGAVVGGGYEISRRQSQLPSPMWMGPNGFVVGTHTGHLVHLTEARLKVNPRNQGASICYVKDGIPRVIMSMSGIQSNEDAELSSIFDAGTLI